MPPNGRLNRTQLYKTALIAGDVNFTCVHPEIHYKSFLNFGKNWENRDVASFNLRTNSERNFINHLLKKIIGTQIPPKRKGLFTGRRARHNLPEAFRNLRFDEPCRSSNLHQPGCNWQWCLHRWKRSRPSPGPCSRRWLCSSESCLPGSAPEKKKID